MTASRNDRPVAVLPWLDLDDSLTCAGIQFIPRDRIDDFLLPAERDRAIALLDCYTEPYGPGAVALRPIGHTIAFPDSAPADDRERSQQAKRLIYVCNIVGAIVVAAPHTYPVSCDGVRPYLLPYLPDGPLLVPLYRGGYDLTGVDHHRIVRPPWVIKQPIRLDSEGHRLMSALGTLVDPALGGDKRSKQVLLAVHWFIQAHSYHLALHAQTNEGALSTAFEVLFDLRGEQRKTETLKRKVRDLLGSQDLANGVTAFYQERSDIVHGGEPANPLLVGGHMTRLQFGLDLFWLCLRTLLANEFTSPFANEAHEIARLERYLEPNAKRLELLATLNPKSVPRTANNQRKFIETLEALHANPHDWSGSSELWRQALANALRAVRSALWLAAGQQTESLVADDMKALGGRIRDLAENLDDNILTQLLSLAPAIWPNDADRPTVRAGSMVPIIADKTLLQLLTAGSAVIGLARLAVERWHT